MKEKKKKNSGVAQTIAKQESSLAVAFSSITMEHTFLNPDIIGMWLDNFGVHNPDAQAEDFFAAVETAIAPTFEIPSELNKRFKK